jgi:predicted nucleic acid-binding protein
MIRPVLDAKVLLSALLSPASSSTEILPLWRDRKVAFLAAGQLEETARVTRFSRIRHARRLAPYAEKVRCP